MLTLLQESAHAFLLIGGLKAAAEQLFFHDDCLIHIDLQALIDGLLAGTHRNRRILCNGGCQLLSGVHQLFQGVYRVDQTDAQRLVCLDVLGSVDQLLGHTGADQTGQTLGTAKAGGNAQTGFRLAEYGRIGADADIAAHAQFTAAAQCKTVDGRNRGNGHGFQLAEHIVALLAEGFAFRLRQRAHLSDIGAGYKSLLACAGQHQSIDIFVCVDHIHQFVQILQHLGIKGVESLGTVDRSNSNVAFLF